MPLLTRCSRPQGLNVPNTLIQFDDLMEKDKQDALWILDQQLDVRLH